MNTLMGKGWGDGNMSVFFMSSEMVRGGGGIKAVRIFDGLSFGLEKKGNC